MNERQDDGDRNGMGEFADIPARTLEAMRQAHVVWGFDPETGNAQLLWGKRNLISYLMHQDEDRITRVLCVPVDPRIGFERMAMACEAIDVEP